MSVSLMPSQKELSQKGLPLIRVSMLWLTNVWGSIKKKVLVCRLCLAVVLTHLASTHLLLWGVDDHQVGFSFDAVCSAVIPVLSDVAALSKRKKIARGHKMGPTGGTATAFHWQKERNVSVGV